MIKTHRCAWLLLSVLPFACSERAMEENSFEKTSTLPSIEGKTTYLASPFVTAGDRVYMVGHQDGTFPDLGWHIEGEMGGIWDHPVKLMDGFTASIAFNNTPDTFCLDKATRFVNYPIGNSHFFFVKKENLSVERFQFVPDGLEGMIIEFRINNKDSKSKSILFSFTGMTDLRPTWLGERTGMIDSEDQVLFDEKLRAVVARDKNNPWYAAFGSSLQEKVIYSLHHSPCANVERKGSGKNATLTFPLTLGANEEKVIPVFIAGSYKSEECVRQTYDSLRIGRNAKLARKIDRYENLNRTAHLTIEDKGLQQMYEWLKYNCDWLVRNVPEQGIGIGAGLPDYPWWFGADMTYTLQGILATGNHELAKSSIVLLNKLSSHRNGNGRVIHEASTNGSVYNPGNVNETAQYISLLRTYLSWTGDKELVSQLFPDIKKGIKWLREDRDPDRNGYPDGSGMMEIPGLETEMIDVAAYTQRALEDAAEIATVMGDKKAAGDYLKWAAELRSKINKEWWNAPQGSFGDFRGTVFEAKPILQAAIIRADTLKKPWAVKELKVTERLLSRYSPHEKVPFVVYHNWVVNTPLETGIADAEKGRTALETAKRYENPFGVFVTGIDRTEEPDSLVLKSRRKTFSYTGAVMTLPTGVQAVAAARYGTPEEALTYLQKLQRSFSYALPGSMYEVSPDFGMVTQAWNIYGVAIPIVNYFFGIQPKAYEQTVAISPRLPDSWKEVSLENVRIGNNSLTVSITLKEDYREYRIVQSQPDWKVSVDIKSAKKVILNGREQRVGGSFVGARGREILLKIY